MRSLLAAGALAAVMAIGATAWAEEAEATAAVDTAAVTEGGGEFHPFVVGAFMSMGAALTLGDLNYGQDQKPRFAGAGGAYFNYYFTPMFAIDAGLGFIGKGYIIKYDEEGVDIKLRQTLINMEIPLGVKLNIKNIQIAAAVAIDIVVSGVARSKATDGGDTSSTKHKLSGDDWDLVRRFNLGPKVAAGYAIPLGPVYLVPGLSWSMDLINYCKGDAAEYGGKARGMNIMVVVAGEFGFSAPAE
jgi:hypothetical protein